MECAVVIGEVRFEAPMPAFLASRRFHELIVGTLPDDEPPMVTPMVTQRLEFNAAADGVRVVVQPALVAVIRQGEVDEAADDIANRLVRVRPEFQDLKVLRVGVRSAWLQPAEGSWGELREQFARAFLTRGPAQERSDDLGVAYSSVGRDPGYNIHCGPMRRSQLEEQYLPFPDKYASPEFLLFADVDYWVSASEPFSGQRMSRTVREALSFASSFADDLYAQFERGAK